MLYPRRTDFPPDRNICAGTTKKGCYLQIRNAPACGGGQPVCAEYCPTLPPVKERHVELPKPVVPTPVVPTPPPPTPYYVVPPPVVTCNGGPCPSQPYPVPMCNGGPCGDSKRIEEAKLTEKAKSTVEHEHPKPLEQAKLTEKAKPTVEHEHPKPIEKAESTEKAKPHDEPKPIVTAEKTEKAKRIVEPDPKPIVPTPVVPGPVTCNGGPCERTKCNDVCNGGPCVTPPPTDNKTTDDKTTDNKTPEATTEFAVDLDFAEPTPTTDSKGCTSDARVPVAAITDSDQYQKLMQCVAGICEPEDSSVSFDAPSTAKRSVALGVASGIPKLNELGELSKTLKKVAKLGDGLAGKLPLGALIGGVAGLLWPDPTSDELFNQMKAYVDKALPKAIADEHITNLKKHVEGLNKEIKAYEDADNITYKSQGLHDLELAMDRIEPDFLDDPRAPQQALAHFVAFAVLRLTVYREEYLHTKEYWGDNSDREKFACKLNKAVRKYTQAAKDIKQRALDWRLSQLHLDWAPYRVSRAQRYSYARDDLCDWHDSFGRRADANTWFYVRQQQVRNAYGKDLDALRHR